MEIRVNVQATIEATQGGVDFGAVITVFLVPNPIVWRMAILRCFPFGYMRTSMFMRILGFPASGKKGG